MVNVVADIATVKLRSWMTENDPDVDGGRLDDAEDGVRYFRTDTVARDERDPMSHDFDSL